MTLTLNRCILVLWKAHEVGVQFETFSCESRQEALKLVERLIAIGERDIVFIEPSDITGEIGCYTVEED